MNVRETIHQAVSFELNEFEGGRPKIVMEYGLGVDISSGGVGLSTDYPLREGNVLKIYFPVSAGKARLPVFSEVVWLKPAPKGVKVGLRFLA